MNDIDGMMDELDQEMQGKRMAEGEAAKQARFEETAMRKLLLHFGLAAAAPRLKRACASVTGQARLLFDWFEKEHPSFPVRIAFRKYPYTHRITFSDLFKRFSKLPFAVDFAEMVDTQDDGRSCAIAFSWAAMENSELREGPGTMVVHNMSDNLDVTGTTIRRRLLTDPPQTFSVMPYADFLGGIRWQPKASAS